MHLLVEYSKCDPELDLSQMEEGLFQQLFLSQMEKSSLQQDPKLVLSQRGEGSFQQACLAPSQTCQWAAYTQVNFMLRLAM